MPTAQLNIRVPAEHHNLMKDVAARLRQDKDFAEALTAFVAGVAAPVAGGSVASILTRLESVEAQLAERGQKPASASLDAVTPVAVADMPVTAEALPETAKPRQTRKPWADADDAVLRRVHAEGGTQAEAARELGRPDGTVSEKWRALDLPVMPRKGRKLTPRSSPLPD
jgi:hypothetical protein